LAIEGCNKVMYVHSSIIDLFCSALKKAVLVEQTDHTRKMRLSLPVPDRCFEQVSVLTLADTFEKMIKLFYSIDVQFHVSESKQEYQQLVTLYFYGLFFEAPLICDLIEKKWIEPNNEFPMCCFQFAIFNNMKKLILMTINSRLHSKSCEFAENLIRRGNFSEWKEEDMVRLLWSDIVNVKDEYAIFECVKKWCDQNNRYPNSLKNCIRFPLISTENLVLGVKQGGWLTEKQFYSCLEFQVLIENEKRRMSLEVAQRKQEIVEQNKDTHEKEVKLNFAPRQV